MQRVIAIDGPAASGKSTTASQVARRLGWAHLDSGALYRAVALVALDLPEAERSGPALRDAFTAAGVRLVRQGHAYRVEVQGRRAEPRIRGPEVTALVSSVAALPEVRDVVTRALRRTIVAESERGIVIDGRDIGTHVFPEAPIKVFLEASAEERARRRLAQQGDTVDPPALKEETARLLSRDRRDASRAVAPLIRAPDALVIDTTDLSFEEQVSRILAVAQQVLSR